MNDNKPTVPAAYARAGDDGRVSCELCPVGCVVAEGKKGVCNLRENKDGILYAVAYGEVASVNLDPIEKKPLYHFHPGDEVLSLGPNGCNLRCRGCQNYEISQDTVVTHYLSPRALVELARAQGSRGIAYTYTEPLVWFEYLRDACRAAREAGLYNVAVTNGFLEEAPARELAPLLDAANVDVKSMRGDFYRKYCGARLEPVLRTCEIFKQNLHVEITNLLVTGETDGEEDAAALVAWVKKRLGPETPLHFSRYFPHYKSDAPPTPTHHLLRAKEIGDRELYYVYLGNIAGVGGSDTFCPQCDNLLVERRGYRGKVVGVRERVCANCGRPADLVL